MSVRYDSEGSSEGTRHELETTLASIGIDFPARPDEHLTSPRRWLIRGESQSNRLRSPERSRFQPQSGEWGKYGVFVGDCLAPLMYPQSGVFYVFDTHSFPTTHWISSSSPEYQLLLDALAQEKHLNLQSINGGVLAETEIYQHHPIYEPKRGIATFPSPIAIQRASHILVTSDIARDFQEKNLPKWLKTKLVTLH